jgi:hypothetical protein
MEVNLEELLELFRANGWSIAAHNDYQQDKKYYTFYLFTHSTGIWCKGEAEDDLTALAQAWQQARQRLFHLRQMISGDLGG